ncbi:LCP family protein [Actinokineospora sp.]|uniref:LCP family protein n=1 Tax=Actinokineospora sp. TaxID=1872133 RepID=UPI004037EE4D
MTDRLPPDPPDDDAAESAPAASWFTAPVDDTEVFGAIPADPKPPAARKPSPSPAAGRKPAPSAARKQSTAPKKSAGRRATVRRPPPVRARPSGWLAAGRTLVALVSVATLAAMGVVWSRVDEFQQSVTTTDALAVAQQSPDTPPPPADDGANDILVVGNDTRTDLQGRPLSLRVLRELRTEATETINTDTLILLRVPRGGGKTAAVSIPRDTYVPIPGHRDEKINGAFGVTKARVAKALVNGGERDREKIERESDSAGRTALVQTVQNLTGVRVDHYAEVTLYGFYLLTEAIDGVEVCLNRSTSDSDSGANFRRGRQTVRGGDAVSFVRQRKGLPRGDLDRIVRQQTFLASAMNKVLSGDTLTDAAKLNALASAVSKTVVMDPGLHFLDLVNQAQALASGQVAFVTIPVTAVGARNERGQSIVSVDLAQVRAFVDGLVRPPAPPGESLTGGRLLDLAAPARATAVAAVPCID